MKDIFELMGLEPNIDLDFLDAVVTRKLPTKAEADVLVNDLEVIDKTADILQQVFDRR